MHPTVGRALARDPASSHAGEGCGAALRHPSRAKARPMGVLALLVLMVGSLSAFAQDPESSAPAAPPGEYQSLDALRRGAPLDSEPAAAPMAKVDNRDLRRQRGWPEQPPTIPHAIDGYAVTKDANRCMVCHSRAGSAQFQAPMVSVTHFMDRDGQVLAQVSPRRFFCNQCHVVQTDAPVLVDNRFTDVDTVISRQRER